MGTIIQRARLVVAQVVTPPPPPPPPTTGRPFVCSAMWSGNATRQPDTDVFTAGMDGVSAGNIVQRVNAARAQSKQLVLAMTGGSHDNNYAFGVPFIFNLNTWKNRMDTYAAMTAGDKAIINQAITDGVIVANSVIDEPMHASWNNNVTDGGYVLPSTVDTMVDYVKAIFPTMPTGCTLGSSVTWRAPTQFAKLDWFGAQWSERHIATYGSVTGFRDAANARAVASSCKILYSINVLNGGTRVSGCPQPQTGGPGVDSPNCKMTPAQMLSNASVLQSQGSGFMLWRYDPTYMALTANKNAFTTMAAANAALTTISWYRV